MIFFNGWPDAISCNNATTTTKYVFHAYTQNYNTGSTVYKLRNDVHTVTFNTAGTVTANAGSLCVGYTSLSNFQQYNFDESASTTEQSPYYIDVGSSVMLGGILMFMIAYWFVGLVRHKKWNT